MASDRGINVAKRKFTPAADPDTVFVLHRVFPNGSGFIECAFPTRDLANEHRRNRIGHDPDLEREWRVTEVDVRQVVPEFDEHWAISHRVSDDNISRRVSPTEKHVRRFETDREFPRRIRWGERERYATPQVEMDEDWLTVRGNDYHQTRETFEREAKKRDVVYPNR